MLHSQRPHAGDDDDADDIAPVDIRDIHALTPPPHLTRARRQESWEASSHLSSTLSLTTELENLPTMSREFNAMVVAGSDMQNAGSSDTQSLTRIGEDEMVENNPLAIVADNNPFPSPRRAAPPPADAVEEVSVLRVKKDEVASKISAWQTEEIAKINNKFKREDVVINGWESEQVERATSCLRKIERKLDEKRARAVEKMRNDVARAHRKAEEKRASAEAKRGTKVARVLELAHLMKAVGRAPSKKSFF